MYYFNYLPESGVTKFTFDCNSDYISRLTFNSDSIRKAPTPRLLLQTLTQTPKPSWGTKIPAEDWFKWRRLVCEGTPVYFAEIPVCSLAEFLINFVSASVSDLTVVKPECIVCFLFNPIQNKPFLSFKWSTLNLFLVFTICMQTVLTLILHESFWYSLHKTLILVFTTRFWCRKSERKKRTLD